MAFPNTAVIDTLTGASWDSVNNTKDPTGGSRNVSPTAYAGVGIGTTGASYAFDYYRNTGTYGPNSECYVEIPTAGAGNITRCYVRLQQPAPAPTATADAYIIQATVGSTAGVYRLLNSVVDATLGTWTANASAAGFGIVASGVGASVQIDAYELISGTWTLVQTYSDTNANRITAAGYIGILGIDTAGASRWKNFGGGTRVVLAPQSAGSRAMRGLYTR